MDTAIEVRGLHKAFAQKTVVDGLDFTVGRGEVFALLGPNGAGKTTTINILTTLTRADAGAVAVAGGMCTPTRSKCNAASASPVKRPPSTTP